MSLLLALTGGAAPVAVTVSDNTGATYSGVTDTRIKESNPTVSNDGSGLECSSWVAGDRTHSLIKFTGLSSVPAGTVTNAKLRLYCTFSVTSPETEVFALKTDFNEAQATWNQKSTGVNWGTAGALNATSDFTNTLLSSKVVKIGRAHV